MNHAMREHKEVTVIPSPNHQLETQSRRCAPFMQERIESLSLHARKIKNNVLFFLAWSKAHSSTC